MVKASESVTVLLYILIYMTTPFAYYSVGKIRFFFNRGTMTYASKVEVGRLKFSYYVDLLRNPHRLFTN